MTHLLGSEPAGVIQGVQKQGQSRLKASLLAIIEIGLVYALLHTLGNILRSTGWAQTEVKSLGWSYTGMAIFVAVPALIIWLARRSWADYCVTFVGWPKNLDIGLKAYLVALIPLGTLAISILLRQGYTTLQGGLIIAFAECLAIAVMLWVLRRQKPVASGRKDLIVAGLLLLFPIIVALAMGRFNLLILSTVVWQFVFSGFGEEFVWRGYVQSRLNQAFGRPYHWFGIQFGPGLLIASLLFGLTHALNTFDPPTGRYELAWGWALWTTFAGLFFGILREKTGSLIAPGIAHGLPDAVGESLRLVLGLT